MSHRWRRIGLVAVPIVASALLREWASRLFGWILGDE
jgi:cobalamin synthase